MNDIQKLTDMWAAQEAQIEQSVKVNTLALKEIKSQKAQDKLRGYLSLNQWTAALSVLITVCLGYFVGSHQDKLYMMVAGVVVMLWSISLTIGAIGQIVKIKALDYAKPVVEVQTDLNNIRLSALFNIKTSLMVLPFYFAFMLIGAQTLFGVDMVEIANPAWLKAQSVVSVLFALVAAWLYRFFSPKNVDKPMVKWLMQGVGDQTLKAAKELEALKEFEK